MNGNPQPLVEGSLPVDIEPATKRRPGVPSTQFALKAVSLAKRFEQVCSVHRLVSSWGEMRLQLAAPEGPSTGGGVQSVQHVLLVPPSGSTMVIGQANQKDGTCELRSFDCVADIHGRRYRGERPPFSAADYAVLLERIENFFKASGLTVYRVEDAIALPGASSRRWERIALAAAAVAGLLVIATTIFLLRF